MTDFLPVDYPCSDAVREEVSQKLAVFEALADELPVFIVHEVSSFSVVYMSRTGLQQLGASLDEVRKMGSEYYTKFFNSEDVAFYVPKFKEVLEESASKRWFSFLQQVATGSDSRFEWYLSASRPFIYDEDGKLLLSLTFALPLDPHHHLAEKAERLMQENLMLKNNYQRYVALTKRETELLRYIATGETTAAMSDRLHISVKTLNTHRRNIKRKIGAKTHYDLIKFAQAFNLV